MWLIKLHFFFASQPLDMFKHFDQQINSEKVSHVNIRHLSTENILLRFYCVLRITADSLKIALTSWIFLSKQFPTEQVIIY